MTGLTQEAFTSGELSPKLYGRVGFDLYYKALKTCRNMIVSKYGGVDNRPGTQFIAPIPDSAHRARLIPFQFNNEQQYVFVVGNQTLSIIRNGVVLANTSAYAVTGVTAGSPGVNLRLTIASHPFTDNEQIVVTGVAAGVNGQWAASYVDANTIGLIGCELEVFLWTGAGGVQAFVPITMNYVNGIADPTGFVLTNAAGTAEAVVLSATLISGSYDAGTAAGVITLSSWNSINFETGAWTHIYTKTPRSRTMTKTQAGWAYQPVGPLPITSPQSLTGWGFTIPAGSTITQIEVDYSGFSTAAPGAGTFSNFYSQGIQGGALQSKYILNPVIPAALAGYGSDLGLTYTVANVNSSDFGVLFNIDYTDTGSVGAPGYWTMAVSITVSYDLPLGIAEATSQPAGGVPVAIAPPWKSSDLPLLKYTQSADVMTVCHPNYYPQQISRLAETNWSIADFANVNGPFMDLNPDDTITVESSGTTGSVTITSNKNIFNAGMVGDLFFLKENLAAGFGIVKITVFSGAKTVTATTLVDLPASLTTTPSTRWAKAAWSIEQGYPGTVEYFQDRQWFAGSNGQPSTLWGSRTSLYLDFGQADPIVDDDAIVYKVLSNQVNTVKHMFELTYFLVMTTGGTWMVQGSGTNSNVITPTSINLQFQVSYPVGEVRPNRVNNYGLFVTQKGSQVRTVGYSFAENAFVGQDTTTMSNHLVQFNSIVEWAYQENPYCCSWAVRDDGALLGETFFPEQQITGWHRHDTLGLFESVCCVTENNEDVVYFIVKRTLQGQTVRCIERMAQRDFVDAVDAYFVDCGITYDGRPTNTPATHFTGAGHLAGETVSCLADGIVIPQFVMPDNGAFDLANPALVVHVGLPYLSDFETLDIASKQAEIRDKQKIVTGLSMIVDKSAGFLVGPDVDNLVPYVNQEIDYTGQPDDLISDLIDPNIIASWEKSERIFVRQANPLPLSILAVIPQIEVGEW